MSSMKAVGRETLALQLKSLFIFEFLNTYNEFEKTVRKVFEDNLENLPETTKQKLYFFYGGKLGTFYEYDEPTVKLNSLPFKKDEKFKDLTINQIIKIFKADPCIDAFNFQIPSLQRSTTVFPFYDCAIKLLNMRNKLAHEMVDLQFKDNKDLIELLIFDHIKKESFQTLQSYDIENMDNMTQYIASNIVYMRKLINHLTGQPSSDTEAPAEKESN